MRDIVPLKPGRVHRIFGTYPNRVVKSRRRVCLNRLSHDAMLGFIVASGLIAMTVAIG